MDECLQLQVFLGLDCQETRIVISFLGTADILDIMGCAWWAFRPPTSMWIPYVLVTKSYLAFTGHVVDLCCFILLICRCLV